MYNSEHQVVFYLICRLLSECVVICFWCLRLYRLNFFFDCPLVQELFPGKVGLTFEFCFCFSVQKNTQYVLAFDAFVIVICLASLILCTRSIFLALSLRKVSVCSNFPPPLLASILSVSNSRPWCWVILPFLGPSTKCAPLSDCPLEGVHQPEVCRVSKSSHLTSGGIR